MARLPTPALLLLLTISTALPAFAEDFGKSQYNKCAACHSLEPGVHLSGPSLYGVLGRQAGTVAGFAFSPAMEAANLIWTRESLSAYIENPMGYLPGTVMAFGGIRNPEQRDALVRYLEQQLPSAR